MNIFKYTTSLALVVSVGSFVGQAHAATPSAAQALALRPIQKDVDFDQPTAEDTKDCTVKQETRNGGSGWVVRDAGGRLLRAFLDSNADNKIDLWCYYKNGVEVYRDVDGDFNSKADQYRWLGTSGIRWGIDKDEDGRIDSWKMISAEEVTAEVVAALRTNDARRFRALLLTRTELEKLGVGKTHRKELAEKIENAANSFSRVAARQKDVTRETQWVHFGGSQPGVAPAGVDGSTSDVFVYDNVMAMVETDGKPAQVSIGSLVKSGESWRLIDLPAAFIEGQANAGSYFFQASATRGPIDPVAIGGLSESAQNLIRDFEDVDKELASATSAASRNSLHEKRAGILDKLIDVINGEDRINWVKQYADTLSAAVQTGEYPGGGAKLASLYKKAASTSGLTSAAPYIKYRYITVEYGKRMQSPSADFAKVQEQWIEDLTDFAKEYPKADDTPEALLQLGLAYEFAGKEKEARSAYASIVENYPSSDERNKAAGAVRRIDSVGKTIALSGTGLDGRATSLSSYRGRTVLIYYWATWNDQAAKEVELFNELRKKYAKDGFSIIGVNVDSSKDDAVAFLRKHAAPWPHLHEAGGLDSRLATNLGVLTLPAMLLIDKDGTVISRNMNIGELETELAKRLRK